MTEMCDMRKQKVMKVYFTTDNNIYMKGVNEG